MFILRIDEHARSFSGSTHKDVRGKMNETRMRGHIVQSQGSPLRSNGAKHLTIFPCPIFFRAAIYASLFRNFSVLSAASLSASVKIDGSLPGLRSKMDAPGMFYATQKVKKIVSSHEIFLISLNFFKRFPL
jgi:hypothetical protein